MIDFIQHYGQTDHLYSLYLKHPLLVTPTPNLLINTLNIIKLMDAEDSDTRARMFQDLLYKQEVAGQNGQVFAPENVIKLLVAMMDPKADEVIWDPSVGNGSFLVNCLQYIVSNNVAAPNKNIKQDNFRGMDIDQVLLRIAGVNLMLNGIDNPALQTANDLHDGLTLRQQPTLIVSNLFFKASEDRLSDNGKTIKGIKGRKETGLLQLIMENLKPGVRAAIIIPETILYDNAEDIILIRRQIINGHKLRAVISLPSTASLFSGTAVLLLVVQLQMPATKCGYIK